MYRWGEHTGELELEIEADSERGVFEEGFAAIRELLDGARVPAPPAPGRGARPALAPRRVSLHARDRAALLADWLGELAFLAEEGLIPERLAALELRGAGLEAVVEGHGGERRHLVKAATYHRLSLTRRGSSWRASVVLDV
jgi:SHS2 domain-containing protein